MTASLIAGLSGIVMTDDERRFYRDVQPAGLILFARNVADRDQLKHSLPKCMRPSAAMISWF